MGAARTIEATAGRRSPRGPVALESGDHLSRVEFERRYGAMPHIKRAELVEGVVYMASPVGAKHARGFVEGPPEPAIEVAASAASYALYEKRRVYHRCGVREYLAWRVEDGALDWWALTDGEFAPILPDAAGILQSRAFPGLRLPAAATLAWDAAAVLQSLSLQS